MIPSMLTIVTRLIFLELCSVVIASASFNEAGFSILVAKVEKAALDFAREVEKEFEHRCSVSTFSSCQATNYNECSSLYPSQECLGGRNYAIERCGGIVPSDNSTSTITCSGLYDRSISTVRIPAIQQRASRGNPTDPDVIEAICSTRGVDSWIRQRADSDKEFWDSLGLEPRAWYFGSTTGAFRIWPARQSDRCGDYDPRVRPWYVAGSSGPKNVVLIIDISGSMNTGDRLLAAKVAAERIVSTLTVSDRITIVPFSNNATAFTDSEGFMFRATEENKKLLINKIRELSAFGNTNFGEAFQVAFSVFDKSVAAEMIAACNSAILFLTDGERTAGMLEEEVLDFVTDRTVALSARLGKPVLLFTYSISKESESAIQKFPAELACAVERGVWTRITSSREIVDALSTYYRMFALGLGKDANKNFVSWVEPYKFVTGNILGTTISVPVYDRSQNPNLFLGVVGIDLVLDAIGAVLGGGDAGATHAESIRRVVLASDAACPPELDLSKCEMQAWSQASILDPEKAPQCGLNCTGIDSRVKNNPCPENETKPTNLFHNFELDGITFEQRVCCVVGKSEPSNQCPVVAINDGGDTKDENQDEEAKTIKIAVPVSIGGVLILALGFYVGMKNRRPSGRQITNSRRHIPPNPPLPIRFANPAIYREATAPLDCDMESAPQASSRNETGTVPAASHHESNVPTPEVSLQYAPPFRAETGGAPSVYYLTNESTNQATGQTRLPPFQAVTEANDLHDSSSDSD